MLWRLPAWSLLLLPGIDIGVWYLAAQLLRWLVGVCWLAPTSPFPARLPRLANGALLLLSPESIEGIQFFSNGVPDARLYRFANGAYLIFPIGYCVCLDV